MITKQNFKELIQTIGAEELMSQLDNNGDYVLMEAHVFNVGAYATIYSMDYNEEVEREAGDSGNLFCDKDDFMRLLEENEIMEF